MKLGVLGDVGVEGDRDAVSIGKLLPRSPCQRGQRSRTEWGAGFLYGCFAVVL